MRFAHKILLHSFALILAAGLGITLVTAHQFQTHLYAREFDSAFTAYLAGVNYLAAHYKTKDSRFVRSTLNFVLHEKFLRMEGPDYPVVSHQPKALWVYDPDGHLLYEYSTDPALTAMARLAPADFPVRFQQGYRKESRMIRMAGPLSTDGSVPGFVVMYFPSEIEAESRALYRQSFTVMGLICLIAIVLSYLFARRALRPIEALTRAARKVHDGDLEQQVPVTTNDEIGLLGETFNEMISSLVRRIALMHRLQEWTVRISKQFESEDLFEDLVEMFCRMTQASFVRLYISQPAGTPVRLAGERGIRAGGERTGMARRAYETGRSQYRVADGVISEEGAHAQEMAVALAVGSKRWGAIHLGPRAKGELYTEETIGMVETLARHTAMAIENTQLYEAEAERDRVQQEMKWARDIQQSLLPRIMPEVSGYQIFGVSVSALEVGGDYFDIVPIGDQWSCIIGDVSGKGVPAAMIMSIVRSLIHTYSEMASDPREVICRVNRKLTPDLEAEMFVTLSALTFDPVSHRATVVRAGHEPFFLVRANGELERLQPPGTAMGLTDVPLFEELLETTSIAFDPGDVLVLFTDGITEAQNREGVELGYDRFAAMAQAHAKLPVPEMVAALVKDVQDFIGGAAQADDITLLVIRRE
ncbi:MAG: SpoIIE family protein phosphatase [Verrucomicrobia bacterium]|nr:SpoIIE family protein phosphatase [Kiritimatiellia bacterium]MCO6400655.1 SpoIIE family protein phosphatase [Verrucomicrobiota bacterium]